MSPIMSPSEKSILKNILVGDLMGDGRANKKLANHTYKANYDAECNNILKTFYSRRA
jgi:hypothetical protein